MVNVQAFKDLQDHLDTAKRNARHWVLRSTTPSREEEAEALAHLNHAVGALERLTSAADVIRGELASALVEHQTDNADALGGLYRDVVGDRSYGFNPEGGAR